MDKLLFSFINTLNLLLLPTKEHSTSYKSSIQSKLEELEGDYYTFFHSNNLQKLYQNGSVPFEFLEIIENIRAKIRSIDSSLWNPNDFIDNSEWKTVREMTVDILKKDLIR